MPERMIVFNTSKWVISCLNQHAYLRSSAKDVKGIINWEFLVNNDTPNLDIYVQKAHRFNAAIRQKRPNRQYSVFLKHYSLCNIYFAKIIKLT